MKRALTVVGIMVLVAAVAIPVMAQGPGAGRGRMMQGYGPGDPANCPRYGAWNDNLTAEQKTQLDKLHQKFFDDTAAVRSQMAAKQSELGILMNTSNPDLEKAKGLQKEINDLRGKMGQERIKLFAEEKKINPDARFGMGWGRGGMKGGGPCGGGAGMGYGRGMGRGFGGGPCWN
ncbi:MAG: periplasmic heavy metal sensor [Desulfobacterota bacterium]|nr:periplasmic heavy metal sensor [Thermodesulfobacteriota bacterium]